MNAATSHDSSQEPSSPFRLDGRVALVTGSSKGLGLSIAQALGRAGARVAMNFYNDEDAAQIALHSVESIGCRAAMFRANVTDEEDVARLYDEVHSALGPVDIAVLNATCDQPQRPIEEYDWAFYQSMLDFFIKSPYLITRACLEHMKQQRWGRIINITSEVFHIGVEPFTAYVAAKGGQTGFSRSLARELAPHGITVNMIAPGWIPVQRHEKDPQELKDAYLASIPAGRWGVPDDVGGAAVFLSSQEASFVTGQTISVNGGNTVH